MPKLPVIKPKELIRILEKIGFFEHHRAGSHAQFKHPDGRRTTIPIHSGDVKKGMLHGILSDINVSAEDFLKLLKKKK